MELLKDIHSTYIKTWNFKKIFLRKMIIYSIHFIKILINLIRYILKFTFKYIFKITPLWIKKKLITLIYNYQKLFFFAKKFRSWLIKAKNFNHVLQTHLVVYFFIRNILFSILRISLEHTYVRSIILNEIRINVFIRTELNKIIKEANLSKEIEISSFLLYRNINSELSYAEQEIYRDLKNFLTET